MLSNAFLGLGLALVIAGFAVGGAALLFPGQAVALARVHGELLVFGALPTLVCGFALRLLPRFFGAPPPRGLAPALVLVPFTVGAALRVAAALAGPAGEPLRAVASLLTLAGAAVFAATVVRLISRPAADRPAQAGLFILAALWLPVAAALELAGPLVPRATALDALLWGFAAGHILAVFSRTAPAFVAARPLTERVMWPLVVLWNAGLAMALLGPAAGWVGALGAVLLLVVASRLYGRGIALRPVPPGARVIRAALRFAFGWLILALGLLSLRAAEQLFGPVMPLNTGAARHALTLGFLMPFIYAYGSRLVPVLTGSAPPGLRAVLLIVVLANLGAALRVGADALVVDADLARGAVALSALSAAAALLLFVGMTVRRLRAGALAMV